MTECSFASDPAGCLKERDRRFKSTQPSHPWRNNTCENCKTGRAHAEVHIPPEPDEEETVPEKMTTKEKVFAAIQRRGAAGPTPIMQVAKASADQLKVIVGELEREGKIKSWPYRGRSGMTAIYTLPDAKDPRTPEMVKGEASKPEKKAAPAKKSSATPPIKTRAKSERPVPTQREPVADNAIARAIFDLEARRAKIDTAIQTLRALG
ncbi:MAG: hypothetical protein M0T69_02100 [Deltaproteobacteria bacterium]|nr:hypothetical protein [Deltaproteobacteria bacterium]